MDYNVSIDEFAKMVYEEMQRISKIVNIAENCKYTNEQFYLDFEDQINQLSVKDHNYE